jgi:hypothetical protein
MEHEVKYYVQREEADTTQYIVDATTTDTTTAVSTRDLDRTLLSLDRGPGRAMVSFHETTSSRSRSPRNRPERDGPAADRDAEL